jgi:hypothetical protein
MKKSLAFGLMFILASSLPLIVSGEGFRQQKSVISSQDETQDAFWQNAYEAATAYLANPSPQNAERFARALPDKPRKTSWPLYGQIRLSNLIFDFETRQNFSILEKNIKAGEPHAIDVGFRLINISDGLAGEELVFVLGRIADNYPRLFLQKLKAHKGKTQPDVLELLEAMMHPVAWWEQQEDEAGYPALLEKRLDIRIEALKSVRDKGLRELLDRCLKILENSYSSFDIDLTSMAFQSGDLPAGYQGDITKRNVPEAFKKLPKPRRVVHQQIKKKKEIVGGTTILLYMTDEETGQAYSAIIEGLGESARTSGSIQEIMGIGERAALCTLKMIFAVNGIDVHHSRFNEFIFIRCHTIVNIRLDDPNIILSYAGKLDHRIRSSVLCRRSPSYPEGLKNSRQQCNRE